MSGRRSVVVAGESKKPAKLGDLVKLCLRVIAADFDRISAPKRTKIAAVIPRPFAEYRKSCQRKS